MDGVLYRSACDRIMLDFYPGASLLAGFRTNTGKEFNLAREKETWARELGQGGAASRHDGADP
jgi:hypothetical protein